MSDQKVKLLSGYYSSYNQRNEKITGNILRTGAKSLWEQGYTGEGVVIAILDTGCNYYHLDLKERIIGGYNFTSDHDGDVSKYVDLNGHGTHVAGIIASSFNNYGLIGMAPDAHLLILKVLNERGIGSINSIIDAINYAINWRGPNNETVNIISLSLGTKTSTLELHDTIKKAVSRDISIVVASGNEGDGDLNTDEYSYPAAYEEVITVGAINSENSIAHFTNTNDEVDIYAPGVSINSTYLNNDFTELSGTSMAVPHISGALALLINKYANLTKSRPTEMQLFNYLMKHTTKVHIEEYGKEIYVLNLSNIVVDEAIEEEEINETLILKCFCETRKSQAFFTQCLNESSSQKEQEFLHSLIQESASRANLIRDFCKATPRIKNS